ncbi:MAG: dTDP-4-dehydrorhamnose reductase [Chitinophagaceae bacterium]|nr:dTDP-4-dehydrorhamnose reductase [Chitinophagaceae bacterium]
MNKPGILVTGAGGQLGSELQQLAPSYPQYEFVFLSGKELPIDHTEQVRKAFSSYHPRYCINCAAYTAVDKAESEKEQAFMVNSEAVGVLASVCKEYDSRFIHISTDYVFDGKAVVPYKENDPVNPQSVYGASKLEGERQAIFADPDTVIIRTSWVYSAYGKNFVKTMMKLMGERNEVKVVSDQQGSPTYAADLAEALLTIIGKDQSPSGEWHPGIYHFSNEGAITWYELAVAIREMTNAGCVVNAIPTSQYPTPAQRPAYSVLDKKKIQQVFGIQLKEWRQSLSGCIQKIKNSPK